MRLRDRFLGAMPLLEPMLVEIFFGFTVGPNLININSILGRDFARALVVLTEGR